MLDLPTVDEMCRQAMFCGVLAGFGLGSVIGFGLAPLFAHAWKFHREGSR
jgi:hypothetical protein